MSRLQIPIRLIALFLTILAGCQQDFTAEVTILGIGPTIEKLEVYIWRDRNLADEGEHVLDPQQDLKIRVPINEYTKKIELVILGIEGTGALRSQGYASFDLIHASDTSVGSLRLIEADPAKNEDVYACPHPAGDAEKDCDIPLIETADRGVYWKLRSHTVDRELKNRSYYVWKNTETPNVTLLDLGSLGANYAVAVGSQGTVVECMGNECNPFERLTTKTLRGVTVRDERRFRIVGDNGTILRCEFGSCRKEESGTTMNLYGVMLSSGDILRAVGEHGTALRCDESGCISFFVGFDVTLRAIWGNDPISYWVAGDGGILLKCDDRACTKIESSTSNNLVGVWGSKSSSVNVVGEKGVLLSCNSSGCDVPNGVKTEFDLKSIHGSGPNNVVVSSAGDTMLIFDGTRWYQTGQERRIDPPKLESLSVSVGSLSPVFSPATEVYTLVVPVSTRSVILTAAAASPRASIRLNGLDIPSGVASNPIPLGIGVTMISVAVQAPGTAARVYGIAVTHTDYLKASNTRTMDQFGVSVSLSGDTLAVGAYREGSKAKGVNGNQVGAFASDSGAVYVFVRSGGVWTQQAYLKASNSDAGDMFGSSVSLSGDTLAVGAPGEDSSAKGVNGNQSDNRSASSGAAYVFARSGGVWTQQAYVKASNTDALDEFGYSVSLSGDTLVVGVPEEGSRAIGVNGNQSDNSAPWSGAVYVFVRTGDDWTQQAYLKASNTDADNMFGHSVSLSNDSLAVGAYRRDDYSGAVYVFVRSGGVWTQQAYLKAANTERGDEFGYSVSLSGDTLAVGARGEDSSAKGSNGDHADNSADWSGAVYVFVRLGVVWSQQAYLKASNTGVGDSFGQSVALSGETLGVGAFLEGSSARGVNGDQIDNSASGSGAVYVFVRLGDVWTQQVYIKASNTESGDHFGQSVALSGSSFAVGAPDEDSNAKGVNGSQANNSASMSGAVYVF